MEEEEIRELRELSINLHSLARVHTSMNWKKAMMNWLKEGDANSQFFHNMMTSRQTQSSIHLIQVGGFLIEGVQNVRTVFFNNFSSHFRALDIVRPGVEGLNFRKLSVAQSSTLVRMFSLKR